MTTNFLEPTLAEYLKFSRLQMAAEAFIRGAGDRQGSGLEAVLVEGNQRVSKFTAADAENFATHWKVVDQRETETGFSGTLFECIADDPFTGAKAGELVMSFRSTEFIDDAVRDNQATNVMEIKDHGFAFGQIRDMEKWFEDLQPHLPADKKFSVTGYSLGGHLATVFNLLHKNDARLEKVVTFNGAGIGGIDVDSSLQEVVSEFARLTQDAETTNGNPAITFSDPALLALYQRARSAIDAGGTLSTADRVLLDTYVAAPGGPPVGHEKAWREAFDLDQAIRRVQEIRSEAARVAQLTVAAPTFPPLEVPVSQIDQLRLDYQIAVARVGKLTGAATLVGGAIRMIGDKRYGGVLDNQFDVTGATSPSAVSNSQWHWGKDVPIFIEDQPTFRGGVGGDVILNFLEWGVKPLVPDFDKKDFGDTHSLVLLVDSLTVQGHLLQLLPPAARNSQQAVALMDTILRNASYLRKVNGDALVGDGQGKAEGDVLENVVNALSALALGPYEPLLEGSTEGNTWHEFGVSGDNHGRVALYNRLKQIAESDLFKLAAAGSIGAGLISDVRSLTDVCRTNFGAFVALCTASPFAVSLNAAAEDAVKENWGVLYTDWTADQATLASATGGALNFTDRWYSDRQEFLNHKVFFAGHNSDPVKPSLIPATTPLVTDYFEDVDSNYKIAQGFQPDTPFGSTRRVYFGDEADNTYQGGTADDHLYGGAGADILNGGQGRDYLEGNRDDDYLDGGIGNDTLVGGEGTDTYRFYGQFGRDRIVDDATGAGVISIDGHAIGQAKAVANGWEAQLADGSKVRLALAADGKTLTIARPGDTGNTITVENFDVQRAKESSGYLGIKLPSGIKVALVQGAGSNFWLNSNASLGDLAGRSSDAGRQGTLAFMVYLDRPAEGNETIVLNVAGAGGNLKVVLGDSVVDANGATITLAKGQTEVSFALLRPAGSSAAASGSISVRLQGSSEIVDSNSWGLTLPATTSTPTVITGDFIKKLDEHGYYAFTENGNYVSDGDQPGALDLLRGDHQDNHLQGLGGSDLLLGYEGDDRLEGGDGSDYIQGGLGSDWIEGGAGDDLIYAASMGQLYTVFPMYPGAAYVENDTGEGTTWGLGLTWRAYWGGEYDEDGAPIHYVVGKVHRDWQPEDGSNYIDGGDGIDRIYGGMAADAVYGGAGMDVVWGGGGDDTILGQGDADFLYGDGPANQSSMVETPVDRQGKDFLDGGEGDDRLWGQGNNDVLYGGAGADTMHGDDSDFARTPISVQGADYLDGEDGNDTLSGGGGDDTLYGRADNDTLYGDTDATKLGGLRNDARAWGADLLDGGTGVDKLVGGGGDDRLFGGEGNDRLEGDQSSTSMTLTFHGSDYLDGGAGNDEMIGGGGADTLHGGDGADMMTGDDFGNIVAGSHHGEDHLDGGKGKDTLIGGGGADYLLGGADDDVLGGDDDLNVLEASFHADDHLDGGDGADRLVGGFGNDTLLGGRGDDILVGDVGAPNPDAGIRANDLLDGGEGNDQLAGNAGDDTLRGGAGDDILDGGAGNDVLQGGAGTNYLVGGAGNDLLVSQGQDYLEGGVGDDTYQISAFSQTGNLTVIDDAVGTNKLLLGAEPGEFKLYVQNKTAYLARGGQAVLAFANGTDLAQMMVVGATATTSVLQLPGNQHNPGGHVESMTFSNGSLVSTATLTVGQSLDGASFAELLKGGSGNDAIDGGAGDDILTGGDGSDAIYGGEGADLIIGGAGNDVLFGGNNQLRTDNDADVFHFEAGDGADLIEAGYSWWTGDGVAHDIIRFGEGIAADNIQLVRGQLDGAGDVDLLIEYGDGDSVAVASGALAGITGIRFADGTSLGQDAIIRMLAAQQSDGVVRNEESSGHDHVLVGGSGIDQLTGGQGDDILYGGAGKDVLRGGEGRNTYLFGADSGLDIIQSDEEQGTLKFLDATVGQLEAFADGVDVLVRQASGAIVRVRDVLGEGDANIGSWKVVDRNGQERSLAEILTTTGETLNQTLDERRDAFLSQQRFQLASTIQRSYASSPWSVDHKFAVPAAVTQTTRTLDGGEWAYDHYLDEQDVDTTTVAYSRRPVYEQRTEVVGATPAKFVKLESILSGGFIPPGAQPVYGYEMQPDSVMVGPQKTLVGYMVPAAQGTPLNRQRLVSWESVAQYDTTRTTNDTATQAVVTGSALADHIRGADLGDKAALFRGSISTGAGDDVVELASGSNMPQGQFFSRFQDWVGAMASVQDWVPGWAYERGLGAWVDVGDGDDIVRGSDGHDFIVGGAGSDYMDGQAGSDTYYVSFQPGDVDVVSDLAHWVDYWSEIGGDLPPNVDTVEFHASVQRESLSYRWSFAQVEGNEQAIARRLQLFSAGVHFLDIDYLPGEDLAGVERFRFADGSVVGLQALLDSMPPRPSLAPEVVGEIATIRVGTGGEVEAWLADHFFDPDGDALTFSAELEDGSPLPWFLQIDALTGALTAAPGVNDLGSYAVRVTGTDWAGLSASTVVALDVVTNNTPQVVQPVSGDYLWPQLGLQLQWTLPILPADIFEDAEDGDALTYSIRSLYGDNLDWLTFDPATGTFSGLPGPDAPFSFSLALRATDSLGGWSEVALNFGLANSLGIGEDGDDYFSGWWELDELDIFFGMGGDDSLEGYGGGDILVGGTGNDAIDGGTGADLYVFDQGFGRDTVRDVAGDLNHVLLRGWAPDAFVATRYGSEGLTLRSTVSGDSILFNSWYAGDNAFEFHFDDGTTWDAADVEALLVPQFVSQFADDYLAEGDAVVDALGGSDRITVLGGRHVVRGGTGNDEVYSNGQALVEGEGGDDQLFGGDASQFFAGGAGDDLVSTYNEYGEMHHNVIAFNVGDGADVVEADWHYGVLSVGGGASLDAFSFSANVEEGSLTIHIGSGDSVTLLDWFFPSTPQLNFGTQLLLQLFDGETVRVFDVRPAANAFLALVADGSVEGPWAAGAELLQHEGTLSGNEAYGGILAATYAAEGTTRSLDPALIQQLLADPDFGRVPQAFREASRIEGTAGADSLVGTANADIIDAGAGNDSLNGRAGNDTLLGGEGNDVLNGGAGVDAMVGGNGNDTYYVDNEEDTVTEQTGEGTDVVNTSVSFWARDGVENIVAWNTGDDLYLSGNALNNAITGGAGADYLDGDAGNDALNGGAGGDALYGGDGNDVLNGASGADAMEGGAGNDTYYVDDVGDTVFEYEGEGTDVVNTSVSFWAGGGVENIAAWNTSDGLYLAGNALNNAITGGAGADTLDGDAGNDALNGGAGDDALYGGVGNDVLNGGVGADALAGGSGNDTYYVNEAGDTVVEFEDEGTDVVNTSVSFTAGDAVERIAAWNTTQGLALTGNALDNAITGGAGADLLDGGAGNDALNGGAGDDALSGGEGNDVLNGAFGSDALTGGSGNDTYYVDDAGDTVTELEGEGTDVVNTSVSFTAGEAVERIAAWNTPQGLALTGNALNNSITGGAGSDVLDGGIGNDALNGGAGDDTLFGGEGNDVLNGALGADALTGGSGNDTYYVDDAGDTVFEFAGEGTDAVNTSVSFSAGLGVENISAWNTSNGLALSGNAQNNSIAGGAGADTLDGGAGNDVLNGGLGDDLYRFARGSGADLLVDNDATPGNADVLEFGADIASDQLWLRRTGNNLEISVVGTGDRITVSGWYLDDARQVETIRAGDGRVLADTAVQALVEAMAGFAPPAAGETHLNPTLAAQLAPTLAASWQ